MWWEFYQQLKNEQCKYQRGPRLVSLQRQETGFGFTLRHFIVYPPEPPPDDNGSLTTKHLVSEPLDTIFVKNVKEGSPAYKAGLQTGDRIVCVNGETISGKSYAHVVELIKCSTPSLQLMVVPKEDDILQKYFSVTAHNPETNPRPHELAAMVVGPGSQGKQFPHLPYPTPYRPFGSATRENTAVYKPYSSSNVAHTQGLSGSQIRCPNPGSPPSAGPDSSCETGSPQKKNTPPVSSDSALSSKETESVNGMNDKDKYDSNESIICRIKKSFEQKEEFLLRPTPAPSFPATLSQLQSPQVLKEFYGYPQKFQKQLWPPSSQVPDLALATTSEVSNAAPDTTLNVTRASSAPPYTEHVVEGVNAATWRPPNQVCRSISVTQPTPSKPQDDGYRYKPFSTTLSRIQENISSPSVKPVNDSIWSCPSLPVSCSSEDGLTSGEKAKVPSLNIVSKRAKQFESGEIDSELAKKQSLYKSELSRLSNKHHTGNVSNKKQEFESRNELNEEPDVKTHGLSGNRMIIIGSDKIHCDPPETFENSFHEEIEPRERTSSIESRSSSQSFRSSDTLKDGDSGRRRPVRQSSYLAAIKSPYQAGGLDDSGPKWHPSTRDSMSTTKSSPTHTCRQHENTGVVSSRMRVSRPPVPSSLPISNPHRSARPPEDTCDVTPWNGDYEGTLAALTQPANIAASSECSLPASNLYPSSLQSSTETLKPNNNEDKLEENFISGDQRLKERDAISLAPERPLRAEKTDHIVGHSPPTTPAIEVSKDGPLHVKTVMLEHKRASDRSWKLGWVMLRGQNLFVLKERHRDKEAQVSSTPEDEPFNIDGCMVDVAHDYTKKKYVFRLSTQAGSELLFQAEDNNEMFLWIRALQINSTKNHEEGIVGANFILRRQAFEAAALGLTPQNVKGIKKLTSFRNRSPTGTSPVTKSRKSNQIHELPSPKTKTWKGKVAKQWKKMHGQYPSPSAAHCEGCTIGVLLEECPPSTFSEFVPYIVELCCTMVESKGLHITGIYRIPGNTAAVASLTEAINKGFENFNIMADPRWTDVNVISSLLKSFFRKLPDPLIPNECYSSFIEASKIEEPKHRLYCLKKLLRELPEHHYETLKYLSYHLARVAENSPMNKMEPRNLAIVFGPTLVRAADDNMITMVNDMAQQCRIVEALVLYVHWIFSEEDPVSISPPLLPTIGPNDNEAPSPIGNHNLLLNNVPKLDGFVNQGHMEVNAKDIVSSIISAANRKIKSKDKTKDDLTTASHGFSKPYDGVIKCESSPNVHFNTYPQESHLKMTHPFHHYGYLPSECVKSDIFTGDTCQSSKDSLGDEVAIRTYTGLSATTQERIRKFELETKAMLNHFNRFRKETEKREWERHRLEMKLQQAKKDMESYDLLDELADNPSAVAMKISILTSKIYGLNDRKLHQNYELLPSSSDGNIRKYSKHEIQSSHSAGSPNSLKERGNEYWSSDDHGSSSDDSEYEGKVSGRDHCLPKKEPGGSKFIPLKCFNSPRPLRRNSSNEIIVCRGSVDQPRLVTASEVCSNPSDNTTDGSSLGNKEKSMNLLMNRNSRRSSKYIRSGSLDSLREHYGNVEDNGDLLSCITRTFDQRLKALTSTEATDTTNVTKLSWSDLISLDNTKTSADATKDPHKYRDPSLHRKPLGEKNQFDNLDSETSCNITDKIAALENQYKEENVDFPSKRTSVDMRMRHPDIRILESTTKPRVRELRQKFEKSRQSPRIRRKIRSTKRSVRRRHTFAGFADVDDGASNVNPLETPKSMKFHFPVEESSSDNELYDTPIKSYRHSYPEQGISLVPVSLESQV